MNAFIFANKNNKERPMSVSLLLISIFLNFLNEISVILLPKNRGNRSFGILRNLRR